MTMTNRGYNLLLLSCLLLYVAPASSSVLRVIPHRGREEYFGNSIHRGLVTSGAKHYQRGRYYSGSGRNYYGRRSSKSSKSKSSKNGKPPNFLSEKMTGHWSITSAYKLVKAKSSKSTSTAAAKSSKTTIASKSAQANASSTATAAVEIPPTLHAVASSSKSAKAISSKAAITTSKSAKAISSKAAILMGESSGTAIASKSAKAGISGGDDAAIATSAAEESDTDADDHDGTQISSESEIPSSQPASQPVSRPSEQPSGRSSRRPSRRPSRPLSSQPSGMLISHPSKMPSTLPSVPSSELPSVQPSRRSSRRPSGAPAPLTLEQRASIISSKCGHTVVSRSLALLTLIGEFAADPEESLISQTGPRYDAYVWLTHFDGGILCPPFAKLATRANGEESSPSSSPSNVNVSILRETQTKRILQRYTLAAMYYSLNGDDWPNCSAERKWFDDDGDAVAADAEDVGPCVAEGSEEDGVRFLDASHECDWFGLSCKADSSSGDAGPGVDEHLPVAEISLPQNNFFLQEEISMEFYSAFRGIRPEGSEIFE